jgi:hypothetical protein
MRFDNFTVEGKGVIPGDVDKDDDVDLNDFNAIRDHFQQSVTMREQGDLNGDGMVDFLDFRQWKTHFPTPNGAASGAVPEPSSVGLALLAAAGLARRSRSLLN